MTAKSKSEKYTTVCSRVSLMRNSWALKRFIEDAEMHHMDDQPGKLIALRLTEHYELLERLKLLPGGLAVLSALPAAAVSEAVGGGDKPPPAQVVAHKETLATTCASSGADADDGEGNGRSTTSLEDAEDDQWSFPS